MPRTAAVIGTAIFFVFVPCVLPTAPFVMREGMPGRRKECPVLLSWGSALYDR